MMQFPGIRKPSIDFAEVRDNRRSALFYVDVDLSSEHSIANNTQLVINIAGNSFCVDNELSAVGYARVHFQDTNLGAPSAPVFVGPGSILHVPFTQILVENTAQPGLRLRILYGVDLDFTPSINAQVTINGDVNVVNQISQGWLVNAATPAAGTATNLVPAASNLAGLVGYACVMNASASDPRCIILAKATAPTGPTDGVILGATLNVSNVQSNILLPNTKITAGLGVWLWNIALSTNLTATFSAK